jgi:hypothetical protein
MDKGVRERRGKREEDKKKWKMEIKRRGKRK